MGPVALILFLILDSVSCTCVWTRSFTPVCHSVRDAQTGYYWWEDLRIVNPNYTANETLSYAYFGKAPNLRRLLIRGAINDIMPGAFDGLTKLDSLILEHNNLQVLEDVFWEMDIQKLYLIENNITHIRPGAFQDMYKLTHFLVKGEPLLSIPYNVFNGLWLKVLEIRKTKIVKFDTYSLNNLMFLTHLILSENRIHYWTSWKVLGRSDSLLYLYLNNNYLTEIARDMFDVMPNLKALYLGYNYIYSIHSSAFRKLEHLTDLCLTNNRLLHLERIGIPPKLSVLNISYNQLTFLSQAFLEFLKRLKSLSLMGNPWQCPCWDIIQRWIEYHDIHQSHCTETFLSKNYTRCVEHEDPYEGCIEKDIFGTNYTEKYMKTLKIKGTLPHCQLIRIYMEPTQPFGYAHNYYF